MQISHSRIECFNRCKYQYQLRYLDKLKTLPDDAPDNALILGKALHTGIEKGVEAALDEYFCAYPVITDQHINEAIQLEYWIPKARALLPAGFFEVGISHEHFTGFIDLLAPVTMFRDDPAPNLFDLWDFKYTSSGDKYLSSPQLHLYKYFYELTNPLVTIRNLQYLIIPKVRIKQKKTENLLDFRRRLESELSKHEPEILTVTYDPDRVINFTLDIKRLLETEDFPKQPNYLCNWCEYQQYCEKGVDYMLLPKNERRNIKEITKKVIWIYGAPFSGKTYFANRFPDPIMLNTDGNIKFVDAPFLAIRDTVEVEGRMTKRTLAWDTFKDAISELEKKQNEFKTLVVDLLEDTYEHCRLWMYDQMNITHESDDSFRAWDKVTVEFLSTIKRLVNMDYENIILISHEDTSRDITRKGGDKITSIRPNIREKIANKIAGMVDIVARTVAEGENYTLSFKTTEVIFGGGRLTAHESEIPLDYDAFCAVYEEANRNAMEAMEDKGKPQTAASKGRVGRKAAPAPEPEPIPESAENPEQLETPDAEPEAAEAATDEPVPVPVTRTRKRRGE